VPPDRTEATSHHDDAPAGRGSPQGPAPGAARRRQWDLVGMLTAPDIDVAARRALHLERDGGAGDGQRRAFGELRRLACGDQPLAGHWGDDAVADALRSRILRAAPALAPREDLPVRWDGFLGWAGGRLAGGLLASAPRSTLAACGASLAAARDYRFALDALVAREVEPDEEAFDVLSLLALRGALEGLFTPRAIRWLVPGTPALQCAQLRGRSAWACALLALRAFRETGQAAGVAYLTAALAVTWFRARLRAVAREGGVKIPARPWGSPPLGPNDQDAVGRALDLMLRDPVGLRCADRPPWPKGWGGPDLRELEARIAAFLDRGVLMARQVLLDDTLATAAVFGLMGHSPSASALVASVRTPAALDGPRAALLRSVSRARGAEPLPELPFSRDAESLFQKLLRFPDPSVELRTPHAMLAGGRGPLVSRLVREGRAAAASAVRTMLDRRDLTAALGPYWLLSGAPESQACVARLARWLASKAAMPAEDECRAWIATRWPRLLESGG